MPRKTKLPSWIPKDSRKEIKRIMDERDGELPLLEFLANRWENVVETKLELDRDKIAKLYPHLSTAEADLILGFKSVQRDLTVTGIARRFVFDEPEELALRLAIDSQIDAHFFKWQPSDVFSPKGSLYFCASRHFDAAGQFIEGTRGGMRAFPDDGEAIEIAMTATVLRNWETLKSVTSLMSDLRFAKWEQGLVTCFTGVAHHNPTQVSDGLNQFLQTIHKMQMRPELDGAINLQAQGLYRLIESISPDLVSEFDVNQDFPWDAEFHRWFDEHPEPLAQLDLTGISTQLHDAVVLGKRPDWMVPQAREKQFEVVLTEIPRNPSSELREVIGRFAGIRGTKKEIAALMEHAPVAIFWGLTEDFARSVCDRIEMFGGTVEIREVDPAVYRLFSSNGGKVTAW